MYDFRDIRNGIEIPSYDYADQPEIVVADNGTWVCAVTTARGVEGAGETFVGISRSYDKGKTWTKLEKIDQSPYETSYSTLIKTPYGRIYCFYDFNNEGFSRKDDFFFKNGQKVELWRFDMGLGVFCFKYSDDNGESWSADYTPIPVRVFDIDEENVLISNGKKRYQFWNVSKPFFYNGKFYHAIIKYQHNHGDFMYHSEGALLVSDNLETERDVSKIRWETLPDGTKGIAIPENGGPVAEEQSYIPLSDGTLFCTFRTIDSHPGCTYSYDGGHTWEPSQYMSYADGRLVRHPRAANFVWKLSNGKFVYWFHNNGSRSWNFRNPAWVLGGVEYDTPKGKRIKWSQPEIFMYKETGKTGISYPCLFETDGEVYVSETEKTTTRFHKIPWDFLETLWKQAEGEKLSLADGVEVKDGKTENIAAKHEGGAGLIFDCDLTDVSDRVLIDMTDGSYKTNGIKVYVEGGRMCVAFGDGVFCTTAQFQKKYLSGSKHRVSITIDTDAGIIWALSDGKFLDGDDEAVFGWTKFSDRMSFPIIENVGMGISVSGLRFFDRRVSVSEYCMDYNAVK